MASTQVPSRKIPWQYIQATNGHPKFTYTLLHSELYVRMQRIASNGELHLNCSCSSDAIQARMLYYSVFKALTHRHHMGAHGCHAMGNGEARVPLLAAVLMAMSTVVVRRTALRRRVVVYRRHWRVLGFYLAEYLGNISKQLMGIQSLRTHHFSGSCT